MLSNKKSLDINMEAFDFFHENQYLDLIFFRTTKDYEIENIPTHFYLRWMYVSYYGKFSTFV